MYETCTEEERLCNEKMDALLSGVKTNRIIFEEEKEHMPEIIIDEEFKKLIPPLNEDEYTGLERSLLEEGCRDALVLWNNTIIDGHNRHEICTKHDIEYTTITKEFEDRDDAKKWILENQFGRRNISASQKAVLGLELEKILSKEAEARMLSGLEDVELHVDDPEELVLQGSEDGYYQDALLKQHTVTKENNIDFNSKLVYFIQAENGGDVKIGSSSKVDERLKQLQIASPEKLKVTNIIPGGVEKEKELHKEFKSIKKEGEWFKPTQKLCELAKAKPNRKLQSVDQAGNHIGVSGKYIQMAKFIEKEHPEVLEEVLKGDVSLKKVYRELRRDVRLSTQGKKLNLSTDNKYRVIYADPPWKYNNSGLDDYGHAEGHYPCMSILELCDLPVDEIAEDNAVLFMWTTSPFLEDSFKVVSAWGFKYKTSFIWDKVKHNYGHYNSVRHEILLICTKGSCTPDNKKLFDSVISIAKTNVHSQKPEFFRIMIDKLYTFGSRVELFSRVKVDGWDAWGNELDETC